MDSFESHYLTIATFRVNDIQLPNEVTIDDHMPFKATIRKVCICGSLVEFDLNTRKWLCSTSGAELEVNRWNSAPLLMGTELGNLNVSDLEHPHCTSVVTFDENSNLVALLRIEPKDQWVISDPLPIFNNLTVEPFETDLLLKWYLSIDDNLSSGISFEIHWNVADPVHRRTVERLASSQNITLLFLDASSLVPLGASVLELYQPSIQAEVMKALALVAALPKEEKERREQLSMLALGRDASMLSFMDKQGLCPRFAGFLFCSSFSIEKVTEMMEHMKNCPICKEFQRS
jgi:hypothetical protein